MSTPAKIQITYPEGSFAVYMSHDGYPDTVIDEVLRNAKREYTETGTMEKFLLSVIDPWDSSLEPADQRSVKHGYTYSVTVSEDNKWTVEIGDDVVGELDELDTKNLMKVY